MSSRCAAVVAIIVVLLAGLPTVLPGQTYGVAMWPYGATAPTRQAHTQGHTANFKVINEGATQSFTFTCSAGGSVTCAGVSPTSANISEGTFVWVSVTYNAGNEGTGQVYLAATGPHSSDQGSWIVPVVLPSGAPKVSVLPYLEANQDLGRCAMGCFAATYAQSTVPYVSLDAPRAVTLAYHGDRVAPKPFVLVDVRPDSSFGTWPSEYQLKVKVNGNLVTFLNGETTLRFSNPGNITYRIGGQFTPPSLTHGDVKPMEILVSAKIGTNFYENRWITQYLHLDEAANAVARGWSLAGIQRAFITAGTGVLVTEGDGSATYFRYNQVTGKYDTPTGDFSSLVPVSGVWVRAYPDSTKVTFNGSGQMVRVADAWGVRDTILYSSGKVTQIRDHLNNTITLAYGAYGLSSITDPFSRVTTLTVAANRTLTAVQDPDNVSTTFGYDGSLRLQTITNRAGATTTLAYDSQSGKISTVTAPAVAVYGQGTVAPVTTLSAWQTRGVPYGATSSTPFTPVLLDSVWASATEPGGAVVRLRVNRWGSPVLMTQPHGDTTRVAYTFQGLPARVVRPGYEGADFDTVAYNGSGLVTFSRPAAGAATTITYGPYAAVTIRKTVGQDSLTWFRSAQGRLDSLRVGSSTVARYVGYDSYGRPLEVRGPTADTMRYAYYTSGSHRNLQSATASGGRTTTYRYDSRGRVVFVQRPAAPHDSLDYGIMNQVTTRRSRTAGGTLVNTTLQYDSLLRLSRVTDAKNQVYEYHYNALGWLTVQVDPVARTDSLWYSVNGELRRHKDRRDLAMDFSYDSLHRVTSRVGTSTATFSYPQQGRLLVGVSSVATDTLFMNVRGQPDSAVTRMAGRRYARHYRYTAAGLQDSLRVTGDAALTTRGYGWDTNRGLLTAIKLGVAQTTLAKGAALQDTALIFPGSAGSIVRTIGSLRAPVKIVGTAAPNLTERWLGFDALGRIQAHLTVGGTQGRFVVYDSLGRFQQGADSSVSSGSPPPGCPDGVYGSLICHTQMTWQYVANTLAVDTFDLVGNRTSKGGTYGTGNRITAFNGCTYLTDAAGSDSVRTCGDTVTTFTWNREGQLTGLEVTGQPTQTFEYDAFGRLVKRTVGSTASHFLWDGDALLAELGSDGTTVTAEYSYYPGLDRLHAMIVGGTRYYAHADGLGNVIALIDEMGDVKRTLQYDDWGQLSGSTDPAGTFGHKDRARWKGALWVGPEAEVYYMRHRWYEPRTGRFLSEDPVGLAGGINPYVYANNDPVNGRDPRGLCAEVEAELWRETYVNGKLVSEEFLGYICKAPEGGGAERQPGDTIPCSAQFRDLLLSLGFDAAGGWLRVLSAARGFAHAAALERTAVGLFANGRGMATAGNLGSHGVFAGAGFGALGAASGERFASEIALLRGTAGLTGRTATRPGLIGGVQSADAKTIGLALPWIGSGIRFVDWSRHCL